MHLKGESKSLWCSMWVCFFNFQINYAAMQSWVMLLSSDAVVNNTEGHFIEYQCDSQSIMYEKGMRLFLSTYVADIGLRHFKIVIAILQ